MTEGPIAVFGGTFDPVHYGHLRSAVELIECLDLAQLSLMPCANPPHREQPLCSAEHRAAMVELAVADEPRLYCDRRELRRDKPSWTIDSLQELRAELGEQRSLCWVMGCDALLTLDSWHRWQELLDYAHIIVVARPGWQFPESGIIAQWLQQFRSDSLESLQASAGSVRIEYLRPQDISSTEIRQMLAAGKSPRYLLPQSVLHYIDRHDLY